VTGDMRCDFAIQEPALAIAPVFLTLQKSRLPRRKLEVSSIFGNSVLRWYGPEVLGIPEQSLLLALLSIAGQQSFSIDPDNANGVKGKLLKRLSCAGPLFNIAVVITTWRAVERAAGYSSHGGNNTASLIKSMERLAKTRIWERCDGIESESQILSWIIGDDNSLIVALNRRNTDAMSGKHFIKISLEERRTLPDERARALHAYLSGRIRSGSTRKLVFSSLQAHIWYGEATGSTGRSREVMLRSAIHAIDMLPDWRCVLLPSGHVEVRRINNLSIKRGSDR